jgi:Flp pilus assembly pilin Flp
MREPTIRLLGAFLKEEQGQDLVEYALLLAMVALASSGLFVTSGASISGIWSSTKSTVSTAHQSSMS